MARAVSRKRSSARLQFGDVFPDLLDHARYFVTWHDGIVCKWKLPKLEQHNEVWPVIVLFHDQLSRGESGSHAGTASRSDVKIEKVEDSDYGRFAWITDPEGNRIELWEPKSK